VSMSWAVSNWPVGAVEGWKNWLIKSTCCVPCAAYCVLGTALLEDFKGAGWSMKEWVQHLPSNDRDFQFSLDMGHPAEGDCDHDRIGLSSLQGPGVSHRMRGPLGGYRRQTSAPREHHRLLAVRLHG